jgi:hypothetical protein
VLKKCLAINLTEGLKDVYTVIAACLNAVAYPGHLHLWLSFHFLLLQGLEIRQVKVYSQIFSEYTLAMYMAFEISLYIQVIFNTLTFPWKLSSKISSQAFNMFILFASSMTSCLQLWQVVHLSYSVFKWCPLHSHISNSRVQN